MIFMLSYLLPKSTRFLLPTLLHDEWAIGEQSCGHRKNNAQVIDSWNPASLRVQIRIWVLTQRMGGKPKHLECDVRPQIEAE
jgi:hypothetical protein